MDYKPLTEEQARKLCVGFEDRLKRVVAESKPSAEHRAYIRACAAANKVLADQRKRDQ